jgi:hypothetical protein
MNNLNEQLNKLEKKLATNIDPENDIIRRGRPKRENLLTNRSERVNNEEIKERVQLIRTRKRIPLSEQRRLMGFNQKEGFTYRMVNDTFDRISKFEQAGWTIVDKTGDEIQPDLRMQDPTWNQKAVSQPLGGGLIGYMMCIPTELYKEDLKRQQQLIDETESSFKSSKRIRDEKNASYEAYGEVKIHHSFNK